MAARVVGSPETLLRAAAENLHAGRAVEARAQFEYLASALPSEPAPSRGLAEALLALGRADLAEPHARRAVALDRRGADGQVTLAGVLAALERTDEAERALRAAMTSDRRHSGAALALSHLLQRSGRIAEAAQATAPLAAGSSNVAVICAHADAMKALGRHEEALALYRRWTQAAPRDPIALHNLASVLADLRRDDEALAILDQARSAGADAPETWLVRAHVLQGLGRLDEAEEAYRTAIARRSGYPQAIIDLARLLWVRTGDLACALKPFDALSTASTRDTSLRIGRARLIDWAGDKARAYRELAAAVDGAETASVEIAASQLAASLDPERAGVHARAALAAAPGDATARLTLAEAWLAQGRPDAAGEALASVLREHPFDQQALALEAMAWRLTGDARYGERYDYLALVQAFTIATPPGWRDLAHYLVDLSVSLEARHGTRAHPIGQSLRGGTQTGENLRRSSDPAIAAFFEAVRAPIQTYMAALGRGKDVLRRRNTRRYDLAGAWSVRLAPGGRHLDHIHPEGWLSSAFYVGLPSAVEAGAREGWLKFGEPGIPHSPPLAAEHYVKPEPGRLVLFPSYMWHGTVPFGGDACRLTMAVDIVPA